jgi:thymidine kinase
MIKLKKSLLLCILIFYSLFSADHKKNISAFPFESKKNTTMETIKNFSGGIHVFLPQNNTLLHDMVISGGGEKKHYVMCDASKIKSPSFEFANDILGLTFKDEQYGVLLKKWLSRIADHIDVNKNIDLNDLVVIIENSHCLTNWDLEIIYNISFFGVNFLVSGNNKQDYIPSPAMTFLYSVADEIHTGHDNSKLSSKSNLGSIEVICGPMFGGKTSRLIEIGKKAQDKNENIIVVKHAFDGQRYEGVHELVSHKKDHERIFAVLCANSKEFEELIQQVNDIDVCIIDEIQFFDSPIINVIEKMKAKGVRVVVGGLDLDFRAVPFQFTLPYLISIADVVTKVKAICEQTNSVAQYSQRLINGISARASDPIVLTGGKESYQPRSRESFDIDRVPVNEWYTQYVSFLGKFKKITNK